MGGTTALWRIQGAGAVRSCPLTVIGSDQYGFKATRKHNRNIFKNTKYLSGNAAHDCQNAFRFRGEAPWFFDQGLCPGRRWGLCRLTVAAISSEQWGDDMASAEREPIPGA